LYNLIAAGITRLVEQLYYIYILASKRGGRLYVGVTNDLLRRVSEHKTKAISSYTAKYQIQTLVYFESVTDPLSAISREKQLKHWKRDWKIDLIEQGNPSWQDLYDSLV
jgi:putative endonuclease